MIDQYEQGAQQQLIDELEAVSPSLATWAYAEFDAGTPAASVRRLLEAAVGARLAKADDHAPMSVYLSGPMKGYPESNYPLFHSVARHLRDEGHTVHNPAEFPHAAADGPFPLRKAFAAYCKFICEEADTIVLLPGWENSLGVSAELALAKNCGLNIIEWKEG